MVQRPVHSPSYALSKLGLRLVAQSLLCFLNSIGVSETGVFDLLPAEQAWSFSP